MSEIICTCLNISKDEIKEAISSGADTQDKVTEVTSAGSICGSCIEKIETLIQE